MEQKKDKILGNLKNVVTKYPFILLVSLIMTFALIVLTEGKSNSDLSFYMAKISVVSALGISLLFALNILGQRLNRPIVFEILGLFFLVGYFFLLPSEQKDFNSSYIFLLAPSYLLSHLLVSFVAYISAKNSEESFWQFNKNLFLNAFLTCVFAVVLCLGFELALAAADALFDLKVHRSYYADVFLIFSIFGSTFIFLLLNKQGLEGLENQSKYPVVLKFFVQFILIPLLFVYGIILYLYMAKIVIEWELPRGWVSYLVLAYSFLGILALLLVHPLTKNEAKSWVKLFSKIFYYTLIPALFLLFVAIFTRILEYSFTEARYFLLLLAIWLSVLVVYFAILRRENIKFIPISLFILGVFALSFPYLKAFSVSLSAQKKDFQKVLVENRLLVDGKINFNINADQRIKNEVRSKFKYLYDRKQKDFLVSFLNADDEKRIFSDKYSSYFGNLFTGKAYDFESVTLRHLNNEAYHDIKGYDYIIFLNDNKHKVTFGNDTLEIFKSTEQFKITLNGGKSFDLIRLIDEKFEQQKKNKSGATKKENLTFDSVLGDYKIRVIFKDIRKETRGESKSYYFYEVAVLFSKERG